MGRNGADQIQTSSPNITLTVRLYDRLHELPLPSFANQRMKLPCLAFKLGPVLATRNGSVYVFHARTAALGIVEIRTTEDLDSLTLVHPWIDFLLERQLRTTQTPSLSRHTIHHRRLALPALHGRTGGRAQRASFLRSGGRLEYWLATWTRSCLPRPYR